MTINSPSTDTPIQDRDMVHVLRNVQAFVILIDRDFNVLFTNYDNLNTSTVLKLPLRVGNLLHCTVAQHGNLGCGYECQCADCPIREALQDAFARHQNVINLEAEITVHDQENGLDHEMDAYLSGRYLKLGDQECMVVTIQDITIMKHMSEEMRLAHERAVRGEKAKNAFLASMSHEIRTPLNAIVGFSQLLTQTEDHSQKEQFIKIIETNNDLLLNLINDVLDMAKIETGHLDCHIKPTELSSIIKNVEKSVLHKLQPGVVINYVLGAAECTVMTDPVRLSQVLINLLSNACKFTPRGAITYGYEIYDDEIYFFVKDTGIGVTDENKDKLFQLFSKGNEFTQGTGLGLAISRAIVNSLKGQIGVESRGEGRGSTFWFTIPNEAAESAADDETTDEGATANPVGDHEHTILIAEDNESNSQLFHSILENNYNLIRAHDGLEAVELYKKYNPDLILMDINMPNMDGYEAVREIRKYSALVPIIAVTAYAFVSDRRRILENGFNSYVSKPINVARLEKEISNCLA